MTLSDFKILKRLGKCPARSIATIWKCC